ncbi:MAG: hypothetical protein ACREAN_05975, partial [Nitrosopumilaceae archaeon]
TVGYKPAGSNNWIVITNTCGGTYSSPSNPTFPGECFISNGIDTKIVTYHFTTFSSLSTNTAGRGGGGSTPGFAPSFTTGFAPNEYPITINGIGFKPGSYATTAPSTVQITTGQPIQLKLLLYGDQGPSSVQHVSLLTNLRGNQREVGQSDTVISWDRSTTPQLSVIDPHSYFGQVTVNTVPDGSKLEVDYTITFAKPMLTSDLAIMKWGTDIYSSTTYIINAWESVPGILVSSSTLPKESPALINGTSTNPQPANQQPLTSQPDIMQSIKEWGGYAPNSISDSQLLADAGMHGTHIPSWMMKDTKWVVDGTISQQDFENALKYLEQKGIVK